MENSQLLQKQLNDGFATTQQQLILSLENNIRLLTERMDKLSDKTEQRLHAISNQVEKRLSEGFEKTTATFTDIIKRLALIDEAQKRITELSTNVVSLQEILSDKQSRGTFGEVQLSAMIRNVIPEQNFALQHTLSNNKRADCILFLPPPTGDLVIDSKFPLDAYRKLADEPKQAAAQLKRDIKKHVDDIASKYIIPGETADGAIMFIPAEAIFAELHANYPELVEYAHRARVWMVSPTTMMAIITTSRAVIKDDATRKQVHIIQEHLRKLSKNFDLFRGRMDKLAQHIKQAHLDVDQIHTSATKISNQFTKIEQVDMTDKSEHVERLD